MNPSIKIYSDYVCPYCYFAEHMLNQATQEQAVTVEWMPFELRPAPNETLRPEGEYLQRVWDESVYPMAKQLGVHIVLPRISPQPHTGLAFEGYQYALDQKQGNAYTHRMFTAFFQEEQNIGELDVLCGLAEELGMDRQAFRRALETGQYRERHSAALRHAAQEMHITAAPTFVIDRHVLRGLPSLSMLRQFLTHAQPS
jgi:predicted DsbA family dithiol-disulfide isomerase